VSSTSCWSRSPAGSRSRVPPCGREVALGLLVELQGGASRPRAQGIDPAAEIEERFGAPPWPRSAVAGTTDSTAGFAWMRARRRAPLTLLDRTSRERAERPGLGFRIAPQSEPEPKAETKPTPGFEPGTSCLPWIAREVLLWA
jgi:hypothetical protein